MLYRASVVWTSSTALLALVSFSPSWQKAAPKRPAAKSAGAASAVLTGKQLFAQHCAGCHGANGEGTASYSHALTGNQSIEQLSKYIAQSMPPGDKKCPPADAKKIAPYIYDTFYSPLAQERSRPARVALSRLTVRQYKNTLSDLVGSFQPPTPAPTAPAAQTEGLKADYFKARNFRDSDRILQRVDSEVRFDWGRSAPIDGQANPHQFSVRWEGSIEAPDTGFYEIGVRTEHAVRLWVNDPKTPLMDAWVQSGKDPNHHASIYLIGGRTYPVRIEFTKSTQGVDDSEKKKNLPAAPASITLFWKRPNQAEETVPARCLVPDTRPETFVVNTPFPPDDRSMGYERGNAISKEWEEATTSAALETADYIGAHLGDLAGTDDDPARLRAFCHTFVERALRHPLDKETETRYITKQFEKVPDPQKAVRRVVLLTLKSPRFLYREPGASFSDPYAVASRLSFALWDSLPDAALLQAAAAGKLTTRAQVNEQAQRMASDPRAWSKQREFFLQWLKLDQYPDLVRDPKRFPDFTPAVARDLRTSLDLTLENVVGRSERSDFRELLLSDKVYLNGRLAPLYGVKMNVNAPFQPVALDSGSRAGILTHPYLLASFSYFSTSSPIHRGVLLTRSIMGRTLAAPPAAFTPLAASSHPNLTTRQRVALQTKPAACSSCHSIINPLGFTMERFDAIGRLRSSENNLPIDTKGGYAPVGGKAVAFSGATDLARYAAKSDEVREAFVQKLFQYEIKQPVRAYGPQMLPHLKADFAQNGYNIRQLTAQIASETALPSLRRESSIK